MNELKETFFNTRETQDSLIEAARLYRAGLFENLLFEADSIPTCIESDSISGVFESSQFGNFSATHIVPARVENGLVNEREFHYSIYLTKDGQNEVVVYNCCTVVERCGEKSDFPGMIKYTTTINGMKASNFEEQICKMDGAKMELIVNRIEVTKSWTREECQTKTVTIKCYYPAFPKEETAEKKKETA